MLPFLPGSSYDIADEQNADGSSIQGSFNNTLNNMKIAWQKLPDYKE
jgi:hypothetical protein